MRLSNDFDRFCAAVQAGQKPPVPALYLGQRDLGHVVAVAERIHRLRVSVIIHQFGNNAILSLYDRKYDLAVALIFPE